MHIIDVEEGEEKKDEALGGSLDLEEDKGELNELVQKIDQIDSQTHFYHIASMENEGIIDLLKT